MDLNFITEFYVPVIVVACLVTGFLIKHTPGLDRLVKFIPIIVAVLGGLLGSTINGLTVESVVYGAVSGLASTGLHQAFTKLIGYLEDGADE